MPSKYVDPISIMQVIGCVYNSPNILDDKDKYIVTYESGRKVWYDLKKLGEMPESHLDFILNAKCIPIYANKYNGTHEGEHLADKFI